MDDRKTTKLWKKKRFWIPLTVIFFVIGLRIVLEPVLLKVVNQKARDFHPVVEAQVGDVDLALFRGGILLQNVKASLKKNHREFFEVKDVLIDLAWREIFKGHVSFDVLVNDFQLTVTKDLLDTLKKIPEVPPEEVEVAEKKKLPFNIGTVTIMDSEVVFPEFPGLNEQKYFTINDIHGTVSNITGEKGSELSEFDIQAKLDEESKLSGTGHFDISAEPVRWDLNGKLVGLQLPSLNKVLEKYLPANYRKGSLDVYSEVKSEKGKIYGYVKPFMNDVQMMGNKKEWESGTHFFIELLGSTTNFALENSNRKTVATRIPFIYEDGAFSLETGGAIVDAIKHGLLESEIVERGVEDKYRLNRRNPEEVEAQEEDLEKAKKEKKKEEKDNQ